MIVFLSGVSGSGKNTIINYLLSDLEKVKGEKIKDIIYIVSSTTRKMRVEDNEMEGKPYHFISKEEFEKGINNDEFFEWNNVHGNYYGVPKESIELAKQKDVLVIKDIDVDGHRTYLEKLKDSDVKTFSIFLTLSPEILSERLKARGEDEESIKLRLSRAAHENKAVKDYDFVVQNTNSKLTSKLIGYKILQEMQSSDSSEKSSEVCQSM